MNKKEFFDNLQAENGKYMYSIRTVKVLWVMFKCLNNFQMSISLYRNLNK